MAPAGIPVKKASKSPSVERSAERRRRQGAGDAEAMDDEGEREPVAEEAEAAPAVGATSAEGTTEQQLQAAAEAAAVSQQELQQQHIAEQQQLLRQQQQQLKQQQQQRLAQQQPQPAAAPVQQQRQQHRASNTPLQMDPRPVPGSLEERVKKIDRDQGHMRKELSWQREQLSSAVAAEAGKIAQVKSVKDWDGEDFYEALKQLCKQAGLLRRDLVDYWQTRDGYEVELRNSSVIILLLKAGGKAPYGKGTSMHLRESKMEIDLERPLTNAIIIIETPRTKRSKRATADQSARQARAKGGLLWSRWTKSGVLALWSSPGVADVLERCEQHMWQSYPVKVVFKILRQELSWDMLYQEEERIKGAMGKGRGKGKGTDAGIFVGGGGKAKGKSKGKAKSSTAGPAKGKSSAIGKVSARFQQGGDFSEELAGYTHRRRPDLGQDSW